MPAVKPLHQSPESAQDESSNLDLLRSCAVLLVVLEHLFVRGDGMTTGFFAAAHVGAIGVRIFFVHTCLVLMFSLQRLSKDYDGMPRAVVFIVRRAFRIYPLSMVSVLFVVAFLRRYGPTPLDHTTIWSNLLLVQNFTGHDSYPGQLWTLPIEFQMYLLLPALYGFIRRSESAAPAGVAALWLACVFISCAMGDRILNVEFFKFVPCFLPGALAFTLASRPRTIAPGTLVFYTAATCLLFPVVPAHGALRQFFLWSFCLGLGLLIPHCREIRRPWLIKGSRLIARYSYGIYLTHARCIAWVFQSHASLPAFIRWPFFLGALTASSFAAYHLIEAPAIGAGRWISGRRKT